MRLPRRHDFDLLLLRVLVIEYECIREIVLFLCHEVMRSKKNKINNKDNNKAHSILSWEYLHTYSVKISTFYTLSPWSLPWCACRFVFYVGRKTYPIFTNAVWCPREIQYNGRKYVNNCKHWDCIYHIWIVEWYRHNIEILNGNSSTFIIVIFGRQKSFFYDTMSRIQLLGHRFLLMLTDVEYISSRILHTNRPMNYSDII